MPTKDRKKRELGIASKDVPLVYIDPTQDGFFDHVTGVTTIVRPKIARFIKTINLVRQEKACPFWTPVHNPYLIGNEVRFDGKADPAKGESFEFWETKAVLPEVEGKTWLIRDDHYHYYILVYIVNSLIRNRWSTIEALEAAYQISSNPWGYQRIEEVMKICGIFDLEVPKMLSTGDTTLWGTFWTTGNGDSSFVAGGIDYGRNKAYRELKHVASFVLVEK